MRFLILFLLCSSCSHYYCNVHYVSNNRIEVKSQIPTKITLNDNKTITQISPVIEAKPSFIKNILLTCIEWGAKAASQINWNIGESDDTDINISDKGGE
jgi:hypothetical protein